MVRQISLIGILIAACVVIAAGALGCAPKIATIDTAAALRVAGNQNLENCEEATVAQVAVHDGVLQVLEDRFQARLLATNGGAEAVKELAMKIELVGLEEYAEALDNSPSTNSEAIVASP